jgi:hypothetical protein
MSTMTSFDAVDKVYQQIKDTPFTAALQGGLYKMKRPVNSTTEDAVINSLGMPGTQVQQGVVNLNIHLPNLSLEINGKQDNSQPDFIRAQQLAALAIQQVQEFYTEEYWFLFQQQNIIQSDDTEIIVNIRIEFYSINIKNN